MNVSDIPLPWRRALSSLQLLFPSAIMAGGCLRDRENGRKVKDIDIFLPAKDSTISDLDGVAQALTREGWKTRIMDITIYMRGCDTRVVGVVETSFPSCPPIQIVIGEWNMDDLFSHFDFGICQIMFDGHKITRSPAYELDMKTRSFRIVTERSDEAFVSSINRWARLKEKYEGWRFSLGTRAAAYGGAAYAVDAATPPWQPQTSRSLQTHDAN